jgi:hypothetical protein
MRTARSLQRSCRAISAVLVNRPAISPSSQRRALAIRMPLSARHFGLPLPVGLNVNLATTDVLHKKGPGSLRGLAPYVCGRLV